MKTKPILFNTDMVRAIQDGCKTVTRRVVKDKDTINAWDCEEDGMPIAYIDQSTGDSYPPTQPCPYHPGDILYVRETFFEYKGHFYYKADCKHKALAQLGITFKWHPSIHMPRAAARIFLRVTDVRVERLRDITLDDGYKEGCALPAQFDKLWDNTIKKANRALYGWDANPWVWVIEFERISREEAESHERELRT